MTKPYHQDSHIKIYLGDCRAMTELEDESIQCVITSPPYWGLRKYSGEQDLIWGDNHCEHRWVENLRAGYGKGQGYANLQWETGGQPSDRREGSILTNFCSLCRAWKGALGLEPAPDCGRPFMKLKDNLTDVGREYVMSELKKAGVI